MTPDRHSVRTGFLAAVFLLPAAVFAGTADRPSPPTADYVDRRIEGWTVKVQKPLVGEHSDLGDAAIALVGDHLYDITRSVPSAAIDALREVVIWIHHAGRGRNAQYHPSRTWLKNNGYNTDLARCVDLGNADVFIRHERHQPSMVLHELAHAYHHRVLGFGNQAIQKAYERAVKGGKYDAVPVWHGREKKAYAMTDRKEYFAENTEAFFGTNDFYPFVRAELKKHDPVMFGVLKQAWGADEATKPRRPQPGSTAVSRKSAYAIKTICGWTVHVNRDLLSGFKLLGRRALELLAVKLRAIERTVPSPAVAELKKIHIWMDVASERFPCAVYHPSRQWLENHGENPAMAKCVHIANARRFLEWTRQQPSMVLHEFAHAYHHQVLGYAHTGIKDAYRKARKAGRYASVLHCRGNTMRAYAMNNDQEYFAELSEAYFGTNDFYPFVRAEVRRFDPVMYGVLRQAWSGPHAARDATKSR